eukprot:Pgem_evm1s2337
MAWRLSNLAETLPDEIWQTLLHMFNFNPFVSNFQRYFELLLTFTMIIMVMYCIVLLLNF